MALLQPNQSSETVLHAPQPRPQNQSTNPPNPPQDPPPSYSAATAATAVAAPTSPAPPTPQPSTATPPSPPLTPPPQARTPSRPHHDAAVVDAGRWETAVCVVVNDRVSALGGRGADGVLPAPVTARAGLRRAGTDKVACGFYIVALVGVGVIVGVGILLYQFVPG